MICANRKAMWSYATLIDKTIRTTHRGNKRQLPEPSAKTASASPGDVDSSFILSHKRTRKEFDYKALNDEVAS
jgi:hypothetical protein